jgi:hypothetical protein
MLQNVPLAHTTAALVRRWHWYAVGIGTPLALVRRLHWYAVGIGTPLALKIESREVGPEHDTKQS